MVSKVNKLTVKQKEVRVPTTTTTTCAGFRIEGVGDSFVIKSKNGEIVRSGLASEDEAIAVINRDLAPIGKPTAKKETEIIEPEKTPPEKTLTVVSATVVDGFDDPDSGDQRLIHGMILKCVDGDWSDRDGTQYPIGVEMMALNTAEALQRWQEQKVVDVINKVPGTPLPDIKKLNSAIPRKTWEKGIDGELRPPWQHVYVVYLLNPKDASVFTLINNTIGMRICYDRLKDKVRWMRQLRGNKVFPLVKLDNRPMKTGHGMKKRPELTVIEWRDLSGPGAPAIEQAQKQIGKPVAEVSNAEAMDDEIGF